MHPDEMIEPGAEGEPLAAHVLLPGHEGAGPAHDPLSDARLLGRLWVQIERAIGQLEAGEPRQALDTLLVTREWSGFDDPR